MTKLRAEPFRHVHFNSERTAENKIFCNNRIRTALYVRGWMTPLIFVIKGIVIEEFQRAANFYFLIVCALQIWPEVSYTGGVPTTAGALFAVVLFSAALKLMQDLERFRADRTLNHAKCRRLVNGQFTVASWTDVQVGDFLKVHNREMLPADIVLFAAHEPEPDNPNGVCHVETKSLDGETNLKGRSVPKLLCSLVGATATQQVKAVSELKGYVECEQPNAATTKFSGKVHLEGQAPVPLSISNVLLRSSSVRNTDYVIGLVINTGKDSKVMQGMREPPLKRSSLDYGINKFMGMLFCVQALLCVSLTVPRYIWNEDLESAWYLHEDVHEQTPLSTTIVLICQFLLMVFGFVSVSLYVSVDSNKAFMKVIMERQKRMTHEEAGGSAVSLKVRTMTLIDELGCVSHIFSDKTGTLTQNVMQFRKCSIDGVSYGHGNTEIGLARLQRLGQLPPDAAAAAAAAAKGGGGSGGGGGGGPGGGGSGGGGGASSATAASSTAVHFDGPELFAAFHGKHGEEAQEKTRDFVLHLALCHTVVVEQIGSEKRLSASSPDEAALVSAAKFFGIEFLNKQHSTMTLRDSFTSTQPKFEVLEVLEFSSARKRMSVVVQDRDGKMRLLSKGADSVMLPLISKADDAKMRQTEKHLEDHANDGLRTLILTQKVLDPSTYSGWSERYRRACLDLAEVEKKEKELPNEIERLMSEIENDLRLVGSTAVEDKLQDGVPTTIADMGRAGVDVWVLTGDKEETAINIAFACELFDTRTKMLVLNLKSHPTKEMVKKELLKHDAAASNGHGGDRHALVIDGEVISLVMADKQLQLLLLQLTQHCQSVVACRCAPSQKAQLVSLVKRNVKGAVTLAIGDGANDVAMIQAAHVGVGISGQEGMQAANSADFSIGQFRFLKEMLFVWGRNAYRRMSLMIYYIFYKNVLLTLILYWFMFYCSATGTRIYIEFGIQGFNVIWTALPIVICTIKDRDVSDQLSRELPQLYQLGVRRYYFNAGVTLRWIGDAIGESLLIFFALINGLPSMVTPNAGLRDPGGTLIGDFAFAIVVVVSTVKLALSQYQITRSQYLSMLACCGIWWPMSWYGSRVAMDWPSLFRDYTGIFTASQTTPAYWLLLVLLTVTIALFHTFLSAYQRAFYPEFRDLAMEMESWKIHRAKSWLVKWRIPRNQRKLPLRKDAPRNIDERSFFQRMCSCVGSGSKVSA